MSEDLKNVKEVARCWDTETVNLYLKAGWKLLAVTTPHQSSTSYTMGWSGDGEPKHFRDIKESDAWHMLSAARDTFGDRYDNEDQINELVSAWKAVARGAEPSESEQKLLEKYGRNVDELHKMGEKAMYASLGIEK